MEKYETRFWISNSDKAEGLHHGKTKNDIYQPLNRGMKRKAVKQHRDCEDCIAYYNMLGGKEYRCGLGFQVAEEIETDELQRWHMYVRPYQDECEIVPQPETKEELVMTARSLGIEWDIDEVLDLGECIFE